jgi:mutual gliding-motility protein MglA
MVTFVNKINQFSAKIVFYGAGLSGKSSCIHYVAKTFPNSSHSTLVSYANFSGKTLYFDFMSLDSGFFHGYPFRYLIYSVPGQVFYEETRKLVLAKADGIIFVADTQQARLDANLMAMESLKEDLSSLEINLNEVPYAIFYNKSDRPHHYTIDQMNEAFNPDSAPSFLGNAINGDGVLEVMKTVCLSILERMNRYFTDI